MQFVEAGTCRHNLYVLTVEGVDLLRGPVRYRMKLKGGDVQEVVERAQGLKCSGERIVSASVSKKGVKRKWRGVW